MQTPSCTDGWRVIYGEMATGELYVALRYENSLDNEGPVHTLSVWTDSTKDWKAVASQQREVILWAAVCDYLNTGGDLKQVSATMGRSLEILKPLTFTDLPLLSVRRTRDGVHYMFLDEATQRVLAFTPDVEAEWMDLASIH